MDKTTERTPKFSKRDILKLGVVGTVATAGVLVAHKYSESSATENEQGVIKVDTKQGSFYPLPDTHGLPYTDTQLGTLPNLDAIAFECIVNQDFLVTTDVKDIFSTIGGNNKTVAEKRQIIPNSELMFFARKNTKVFFEGQSPMQTDLLVGTGLAAQVGEFLGGMGYMFKRLVDVKKSSENGGNDKIDFLDKTIIGLGMEPMANFMFQMVSSISNESKKENSFRRNSFQRIVDHLSSISTATHPEIAYDLFRTLNFARQLTLVADDASNNSIKFSLPKVGYKFGAAHGAAIEDCLRMGPDFIYTMLEGYPKFFWENMIKINGGIETTSTTPLFEPRAEGAIWNRILIKDIRFEKMLRRKTT